MKTVFLLTLLLIRPCLAAADQNALAYLYEPVLSERENSIVQRIKLQALNTEFDPAITL